MPTITYPDTLYVDALLRDIRAAQSSIMVTVFLFKTGYAQRTLPDEVVDELIAAVDRGVEVFIALNCSRFEPDVAAENYATALHKVSNEVSIALMP